MSTKPFRLAAPLALALSVAPMGALVAASLGCASQQLELESPDAIDAEIARLLRILEKDPENVGARRDLGHLYWLHKGDGDAAMEHLSRLADAGDAVSAASMVIIEHGRGDVEAVWTHGTAVIDQAAAATSGDAATRAEDQALLVALGEVVVRFLDDVQGELVDGDARALTWIDGLKRDGMPADLRQPLDSLEAGIERRVGREYLDNYARQGCVRDWTFGPLEGTLGALELELEADDREFTPDPEARWAALSCVVRVWNPTPRAGIRRMRSLLDVDDDVLQLDVAAEEPVRVYLDGAEVLRTDRVDRWAPRHALLELDVAPGPHMLEVRTAIPESNAWVLVRATDGEGSAVTSSPASDGGGSFDGAPAKIRTRRAAWPAVPGQPDARDDAEANDAVAGTEGAGASGRGRSRGRSRGRGADRPLMAGAIYAPLRQFYALDDALADGDTDRAERMAAGLRDARFAEGHLLLADFERADPTRGVGASTGREQQALEQALAIDPKLDRARVRSLEIELARGQVAEVIAELEGLDEARLGSLDGALLRFEAYLERGSEVQAEAALVAAAERNPEACALIVAQRRLAQRRNQVKREDVLTEKLSTCAGALAARAKLAETRGRLEEAAALWETRLERAPDDLDAMEARAAVAVNLGDEEGAVALYREVLAYAPFRATAQVALADLRAKDDDRAQAKKLVQAAIDRLPHSSRLREIGETIGIEDDLMHRRADGMAAVKRYQAALERGDVSYEGAPEVFVLDRDIARVYDNGGVRHIIHQVIHMTSKDALDRYGEVPTPDGGEFLTLHSIKPDGTIVEPESIAGKDGLSLRKLEVGDYIELEYLLDVDPSGLMPGYVDLARFRFQDLDTPYHYSELVVVYPASVPLQYERRNPSAGGAPAVTKGSSDDGGQLQVLRFLAEQMPRKGPEPQARSMVDELPMVRVYTDFEVPTWLRTVEIQLRGAQRTNPELRAQAESLAEGAGTEREVLQRVWAWVMDNVDDAGDMTAPATATLAARQGNRLMLIRAMLEHLGVESELWLARDRFGTTILPDGHPSVEAYEAPMLAVYPDGSKKPVMVLTTSKVMPLGYLTPGFSGSDALRVSLAPDDAPPAKVTLPQPPESLRDRRTWDLRVEVDKEGDGQVSGAIELAGMEAVFWRDALTKFDRDRLPEVFQQAELQQIAPGAMLDLDEVELVNEDAIDEPLRLEFTASASGLGTRQGDELVLPASLVSMNLGLAFTRLPERWSGMVVPYSPDAEARVEIVAREGAIKVVPRNRELEDDRGRYERRAVDGGEGKSTVTIETRGKLSLGVVEAADYADFGAFTRDVARAEQEVLRIQ